MPFISILTDFGLQDGFVGVMKGVIYRIAPDVKIVDITHSISPQNVLEGSLVLARSYSYFPAGSIHIAVVDPGVGTQRRPIAARIGEHFFVCPDNGLLTPILDEAEQAGKTVEIVHLDQPRFWLAQVSRSFHGRDIFSPVAAHLAAGVSLPELGSPIIDPRRIAIPQPRKIEGGWQAQVTGVDHFGNLATNLSQAMLGSLRPNRIEIAGQVIDRLLLTFGDGKPGDLIAMLDSEDYLSICVVNGNAAQRLQVGSGEPVLVRAVDG